MRFLAFSLAVVCVWCAYRAPLTVAFPSGAPDSACDTLSPNPFAHGADPLPCPGDPCPFQLRVDADGPSNYVCGEILPLLLFSTGPTPFRGFFIQSRESTEQYTPEAPFVGNFVNPEGDWQLRPCDGSDAGATHTSRSDKFIVPLDWQAPLPGEPAPPVSFWYTVVQERIVYHVQLDGPDLQPDEQSCGPQFIVQFIEESVTVEESDGTFSVCAAVLGPFQDIVTANLDVIFISVSNAATESEDFRIEDDEIIFFEGVSFACFSVSIIPDELLEGNEVFVLGLTVGDETVDEVDITIIDDEVVSEPPVVGFQQFSHSVREGSSFLACVEILSGRSSNAFTLQMFSITVDNSASDDDFDEVLTTVTFPDNSETGALQCVTVTAFSDQLMEPDEIFFLVLFQIITDPTPYSIDRQRMVVTVTILDDIPGNNFVEFINISKTVPEGVGVELTGIQFVGVGLLQDVTVLIESTDGSTVSFPSNGDPADFLPVSATIDIPAGTLPGTSFFVSVSIIDDELLENDEMFSLNLRSQSPDIVGVTTGRGQQSVTIIDNEPPVSLFRVVDNQLDFREGTLPPILFICLELISGGPLLENIIFDLVAQDGSARGSEDFIQQSATSVLFFARSRGGLQRCGTVVILNDEIAEFPESFTVDVVSPDESVAVISGPSVVTVNIEDDDVLYVRMSEPSMNVPEDVGDAFVCVTVVDTSPLLMDLRVRIGTSDGTAIAMQDYTMQQVDLIYPPGTEVGDVQCIGIPITDNNRPEETRAFRVSIVPFTPLARVLPGLGTTIVLIEDDDASQVEFEQEEYPVREGSPLVEVCVVLVGDPLPSDGLVRLITQDGTAVAGRDYESLNTTLTFPANLQGGSRQCAFIIIIDDNVAEAEQSFYVVLTSETPNIVSVANNGGLTTVIITDDEVTGLPQVVFETTELSVLEDIEEATAVCIQLIGDLMDQVASLEVSTQPGTAEAILDYTPFSVTLSLPPNSPNGTRQCTAFSIENDDLMEQREYFSLMLDNVSPNIVTVYEGQDVLHVRILDDDSPMAVVGFQVIKSAVNESVANKFTCIVIFSGGPLPFDASIRFYTQDGTAEAPEDYTAVSTTLTFRAGADGSLPIDAVCVSVPIIDDSVAEVRESLSFHIVAVDVDRIRVDEQRAWKLLYIEDNDGFQVGFDRSEYAVIEALAPDLGLLVCVTVEDVTFPFSLSTDTQDITANEILDYRVNNAPLVFLVAAGNQTQCAYVQVIDDGILEPPETFSFLLSSDNSAVLVTNPFAIVNIIDRGFDQQ